MFIIQKRHGESMKRRGGGHKGTKNRKGRL